MASKQPEFGPFGSGKPIARTRSALRIRWIASLLVFLLGLGLIFKFRTAWSEFYTSMAERTPPAVQIPDPPYGIGRQPLEFAVRVSDSQSGLDQVVIRAYQSSERITLLQKSYPNKQTDDLIQLTLDAKELKLREGEVRLSISAFDRSFWSNSAKADITLQVDYEVPRIEVLTRQHNAVEGGVELVFYRLTNDPNAFSGIIAGSSLFPGFPAISLDKSFRDSPDVYFSFFAIPLGFEDGEGTLRLLARDKVGNTATESIYYRVRGQKFSDHRFAVSEEFLERAVERTYEQYLLTETKVTGAAEREYFPAIKNSERVERFKAVNIQFRAMVEEAAKPLFARPKSQLYWRGTFTRPPGRELAAGFGDTVEWVFDSTVLGTTRLKETLYIAQSGRQVGAANSGKVIFVDEFGPYGKTVIVDHGFGLTSLYTHLSSFDCREGDELRKGESVGRTGSTGLFPETGVGLQFRLHGVAVRPEEWWDKNWIDDHVEKKIAAVKRELGIRVLRPLER